MNFWHEYPYTDFHELNLSWLLKKMKQIDVRMTDFEAVNKFKFYGDWEITKSYPIWSIVSGEDDNGYLAIQNVPAGITLDNEDYWVKVANYSALYADVQRRIIALEDDNETIHDELTATGEDVTELQTDVSELQTNVSGLTDTVNIILEHNRNIIIVGDSYFANDMAEFGGATPVINRLRAISPANFHYENISIGGAAFAQANNAKRFETILRAHTSSFAPNDVTDVLFIGGYNDCDYTVANISAAIESCHNYVKATYPKAKMSIGHFGWSGAFESTKRDQIVNRSLNAYRQSSQFGCSYMANAEYTMHDYNLFVSDQSHPNNDGTTELAKQILLYLTDGTCDVHYHMRVLSFNGSGIPVSAGVSSEYEVGTRLDNNIVNLWLPRGQNTFMSPQNFSVQALNDFMILTTLSAPNRLHVMGLWDGESRFQTQLNIGGFLQKTDNSFLNLGGNAFTVSQGWLRFVPLSINTAGTAWNNFNNIKMFRFEGGQYTLPTLNT